MSVLVVGVSHRTAPVALLEQVRRAGRRRPATASRAARPGPSPRRSCSRPATGSRSTPRSRASTPGSTRSATCWPARSGVPLEALTEHLYVHWEGQAVSHLFEVACGLDSMVVGESQILGQLRRAYAASTGGGRADPARAVPERAAGRQAGALRDRHRRRRALAWSASGWSGRSPRSGRSTGATCSSSAPARWARWPAARCAGPASPGVTVANRTAANAHRLATSLEGVGIGLDDLERRPGQGRRRRLLDRRHRHRHLRRRGAPAPSQDRGGRPVAFLDLALPRDVDPRGARAARRHPRRPRDAAVGAARQRGRGRRRGRPRHRPRGGRRLPRLAARQPRRPHRRRAAQPRRRGRRGRARPPRRPPARPGRHRSAPSCRPPSGGSSAPCCTPRPCG